MAMTKPKKSDEPGQEPEARQLRREFFDDEMLDKLMAATDERGLSLTGEGGFLPEMIKATSDDVAVVAVAEPSDAAAGDGVSPLDDAPIEAGHGWSLMAWVMSRSTRARSAS